MGKRKSLRSDGAGERCFYCKRQMVSSHDSWNGLCATRDHIYPKSLGGSHRVWACRACNDLKADMTIIEWNAWCDQNPEWWKIWYDHDRFRAVMKYRNTVDEYSGLQLDNRPAPRER